MTVEVGPELGAVVGPLVPGEVGPGLCLGVGDCDGTSEGSNVESPVVATVGATLVGSVDTGNVVVGLSVVVVETVGNPVSAADSTVVGLAVVPNASDVLVNVGKKVGLSVTNADVGGSEVGTDVAPEIGAFESLLAGPEVGAFESVVVVPELVGAFESVGEVLGVSDGN